MHFMTCCVIAALLALVGTLPSSATSVQEKVPGNVVGAASVIPDDGDLPSLWRNVDAVVFLRIQEAVRTLTRTLDGRESSWTEYRAAAHEVFRRFRGQPRTIVQLLQPGDHQIPPISPPVPGREYIAFLRWNDAEQAFEPVIMIAVTNASVQSSLIRGLESGMNLESFLKVLRAMME